MATLQGGRCDYWLLGFGAALLFQQCRRYMNLSSPGCQKEEHIPEINRLNSNRVQVPRIPTRPVNRDQRNLKKTTNMLGGTLSKSSSFPIFIWLFQGHLHQLHLQYLATPPAAVRKISSSNDIGIWIIFMDGWSVWLQGSLVDVVAGFYSPII